MTPDQPRPETPPRPPRSRAAIALNLVGFALGLALLWWCGARALAPENREQLDRLAAAPWWQAALLVALALASAALNGLVFRAVLSPVRAIPATDAVAVNTVATLGNYMPFKLGLVFRVLTHNRRNGVPLLTIGAWLAAMAALMLCVFLPLISAGAWRGRVDALWWLTAAGGIAAMCAAAVLAARFFGAGPAGHHRRLWARCRCARACARAAARAQEGADARLAARRRHGRIAATARRGRAGRAIRRRRVDRRPAAVVGSGPPRRKRVLHRRLALAFGAVGRARGRDRVARRGRAAGS